MWREIEAARGEIHSRKSSESSSFLSPCFRRDWCGANTKPAYHPPFSSWNTVCWQRSLFQPVTLMRKQVPCLASLNIPRRLPPRPRPLRRCSPTDCCPASPAKPPSTCASRSCPPSGVRLSPHPPEKGGRRKGEWPSSWGQETQH